MGRVISDGRKKSGPPARRTRAARAPGQVAQIAPGVIYEVRGQRVILDADVAEFYGRPTGAVNQQRTRNKDRFPEGYAFQITAEEWATLQSQSVISRSHGGRRTLPWAYTEHGFAMLATGLRGEQAALIAKVIIDTFIGYRRGTLPSERTLVGTNASRNRRRLLQAIYTKMEALLSAELPSGRTAAAELKSITSSTIGRVKAVLDAPAIKNEHLTAEIRKLEAETAKLYAEAQKTNAESASIWADVYHKRLSMIAQLREMTVQLERDDVLEVLDATFGDTSEAPQLPSPKLGPK
jgi:hypothetical protein